MWSGDPQRPRLAKVKPVVLTRPVGLVAPGPNGSVGLTLAQVGSENSDEVKGYSLRLVYDESALELVDAIGQAGSIFDGSWPLHLAGKYSVF